MSLGGGQTETPVAGSNKYAQIMELMRLRQSMNPGYSYTGGFNASAPSSISAAPSSYYEELLRQQALLNANRGGGRQERDPAEQARINAFMDSETAKDVALQAQENAEPGDRYAGVPSRFTQGQRIKNDLGPIASFLNPFSGLLALQDAYKAYQDPNTFNTSFGSTLGRGLSNFFSGGPGPDTSNYSSVGMSGLPSNYDTSSSFQGVTAEQTPADAAVNAAADSARAYDAAVAEGAQGENQGGSYGRSFDNSAPGEGYGMTRSGGIDGSMFNKGGQVTMNRLRGPNPMGPDDGYGGLDDGEFVINAKSVGKYGIELMNAINAGKISKGKLRGLLEA